MHKRNALRLRALLLLGAGALLALGSFYLLQVMLQQGIELQGGVRSDDPDYIVEKFSYVRANQDGKPRYIVAGARLTHRPLNDVSDVEAPVMQSWGGDRPPMLIHAKTARIDHISNEVQLEGDVSLTRAPGPKTKSMDLRTAALTVYADEDRVETAAPVEMKIGPTRISSTGMSANSATGQISLHKQVRIIHPPVPR